MKESVDANSKSDEITLRDLIFPIWKSRKSILLITITFAILGGVLAFLTSDTYTASSTFMPQTTQSGGGLSGSLGGLASLAGIDLNAPRAGGDIPPSMFATVLASEPFRKRILDAKILVNGDSVSYRSYLENQPTSALGTIQEYTIGLPGKVIELFSKKEDQKQNENQTNGLQPLSNKEYGLLSAISGKVSILNDKKEGVITISVVEGDPIIAAQVTKVTEIVLQEWISDHKKKNAKAQYDFIAKQFEEKQKEFFSIQNQLANYMDRNQNVLAATYLTQLERIQAEFDLVNTVYSELAKQKEQAAIQLSQATPTFSVLDPVKIPKKRTGPNKRMYIFVSSFIGLVLSSCWFLIKKPFYEFLEDIRTSSL